MKHNTILSVLVAFCLLVPTLAIGQAKKLSGKALFGSMSARQIGPAMMSGRISDIDVVNEDPTIIYVGTAGGGLWKSTSAGSAFRPIFDDYTQSIGKVTIDQNNPDTVWVGTGETWVRNSVSVGTGIYKTTNGGTTWEFKGLAESERISSIIVNDEDPNIVVVGVQGQLWGPNEERGIFRTTDGGETWTKSLYLDSQTGCADMTVDPDNPQVLYAAMWSHQRYADFFDSGLKYQDGYTSKSGVYKSTDGGASWTRLTGFPDEPMGRISIDVAPSNSNRVYATIETGSKDTKGLYVSNDAGASWEKTNSDFGVTVRPFYFASVTVDPNADSVLYKCGLNLTISNDGGTSFRTVSSNVHSDIHSVWVDPNNSKHSIIGTDGGVYESLDGGYTYKMFMNLPVSQFYHVSVDNDLPFNVYGGLQDNGSWFGPSQKAGGIQNSDWKRTAGGDGFYSYRHPTDENIVYAESQEGNIVRYNKATGMAKDIKPYAERDAEDLRFNWNAPIHQSPNNPDRIYFGSQYVYMSNDRGDTWQQISGDLTTNNPDRQRQDKTGGLTIDNSGAENSTTVYFISESSVNENVIWVGTDDGNLQVTSNQGGSWVNTTPNISGLPANNWASFIEPGHFDENTAYVTFDNHRSGDKTPYVFKTTDKGKTWTSLVTDDIEGYALSVREDLENPNLLFLGTEFGLFVSIDGGSNWARFEKNVPKVGVRDMVIHPRDDALVLGTHGRGIIIIDDITPLRQLNEEVMAKNLHFFETKATTMRDPGAGGGWFGGAGHFVGPNPSRNAKIVYYLGKRHTFGKMYIEVFDQDGNMIRELPAGKSAGINVVDMPTSLEKPKAAPSNNRFGLFGSMFGPNLSSGTYSVKLTKGRETFETSFTLQYDVASPYTDAERKVQRELTMKMYAMTEDMAYIYYSLKSVEDQARQRAVEAKKSKKKLIAFADEIEKYYSTLVGLGGDFYTAEAEAQIREEISDLYRVISSYPGRPTTSQLRKAEILEDEMKEVWAKHADFTGAQLQKINVGLVKEGLEEISIKSRDQFLSDDAISAGGDPQYLMNFQW